MTLPLVSATDSAGADIFMNHTDSSKYIINGSFRRTGTYTLTGTGKTFIGTIKSEGIPGATVDPATQELVYGDVEVSLKGKDGNGTAVEWGAVYVFRIGQQPQLNLNGKYYILNTLTGEASLQ